MSTPNTAHPTLALAVPQSGLSQHSSGCVKPIHSCVLYVGGNLLECGDRAVRIRPREAAFLLAMEWCRPGFVTWRMLQLVAPGPGSPHRPRVDGFVSMRTTIHRLRIALAEVGLRDAIQTVNTRRPASGFRLIEPVTLAFGDADALSHRIAA